MTKANNHETPKAAGFRMPAEWVEHEATWLSWPKNPLTFPAKILGAVEEIYCRMVQALSRGEIVRILVDDEAARIRVARMLESHGAVMDRVRLLSIPSADVWIRDYGPTFLLHPDSGSARR